MKYCKRCILPDTRPNLVLDAEGVCNACRNHGTKPAIDWAARAQAFRKVAEGAKAKSDGYDCLVPVSGGKDSTWQVITCLEHGLRPLAVTWKTPGRTPIGQANLDNLVSLGVDHIDYAISPKIEAKFMLESLRRYGDTAIPMHMALFNIPLKIASRFRIPLVIWGENAAFEYGSAGGENTGFRLDAAWLRKFGVTQGTTAADWVSADLSAKDLTPYFGPDDAEMERNDVAAIFMGYYFPWDPQTSLEAAQARGFRARQEGPLTGYYDYADIDDYFISIHHYLKWYKFGFTRLFDNLSLEIRNGRMTREQAIGILKKMGSQLPGEDIERFCAFAGIATGEFYAIIEKFRNPAVWARQGGVWTIGGFLVPDWTWS
jgi:N-acetyl sugar amidotransferase